MSRAIGYDPPMDRRRRFVCYFWHNGWDHISLGLHIGLTQPNVEIHLPFGFLRIGWDRVLPGFIDGGSLTWDEVDEMIGSG